MGKLINRMKGWFTRKPKQVKTIKTTEVVDKVVENEVIDYAWWLPQYEDGVKGISELEETLYNQLIYSYDSNQVKPNQVFVRPLNFNNQYAIINTIEKVTLNRIKVWCYSGIVVTVNDIDELYTRLKQLTVEELKESENRAVWDLTGKLIYGYIDDVHYMDTPDESDDELIRGYCLLKMVSCNDFCFVVELPKGIVANNFAEIHETSSNEIVLSIKHSDMDDEVI